ncbi:MAG: hypothetical protein D3920_08980 [Candidatus Electrothrix sp. AW2]|nr:hypothetical protein [Candidatus Electrothrix gigas]MCI5225269.1 hypothetical protein [Candidatus Electrothrix gigas]
MSGNGQLALIRPEGGFYYDEVAYAEDVGFATISLGPRILRVKKCVLQAT